MFKELSAWKTAFYVFVLPLLGLASVSAHQVIAAFNQDERPEVSAAIQYNVATRVRFVVSLDQNGEIHGRVSMVVSSADAGEGLVPAPDVHVQIIHDSQWKGSATTDRNGHFSIKGLSPGVHTLAAKDQNGTSIFAINVLPYQYGQETIQSFIDFVAITQHTEIAQAWLLEGRQQSRSYRDRLTGEEKDRPGHNYVLLENGAFTGQVYTFFETDRIADTKVTLLHRGKRIGQTQVDRNGVFTFTDLAPGIYDVVATGSEGIAAVRFVAESVTASPESRISQVAYRQLPEIDLFVTLAPDTQIFEQFMQEDYDISDIEDPIVFVPNQFVSGGTIGSTSSIPLLIPGVIVPLIPLLDRNPPGPTPVSPIQ